MQIFKQIIFVAAMFGATGVIGAPVVAADADAAPVIDKRVPQCTAWWNGTVSSSDIASNERETILTIGAQSDRWLELRCWFHVWP